MKQAILIIAFVAIVGVGAVMLFAKKGTAPAPAPAPSTSTTNSTPSAEPPASEAAATTITYTDDGFNPEKITVKVGAVIAVKNQSSVSLQFSSDPHPIHTDQKELNQQTIPAGDSLTFTVTEKGTHGFHDHLNTNHIGTIVVE